MHFYNSTIDNLVMKIPRVNMNPEYQRGEVWDLEYKQKLINSIMLGRDIGKFAFVQYSYEKSVQNNNCDYEIIDGKQRLSTIRDFIADRFSYNGKLYSQFNQHEYRQFNSAGILISELTGKNGTYITKAEVLRAFILLSDSGKMLDQHIINHAKYLFKIEEDKENAESETNKEVQK